ncbi:MAG: 3-deoxy-manno-octulosonate cytidylyltransferase [Desulfotalea sp.]
MKSTAVIIPARYSSSRLPAKPLKKINGKPLILHVLERVQGADVEEIIVATDSDEIKDVVEQSSDCKVVMTRSDHNCGTDRIAEVAAGIDAEYIINVQGDQLISGPEMINEVISRAGKGTDLATLYTCINHPDELKDVNVVKVLPNRLGNIINMSRLPIPFNRGQFDGEMKYFKQVGIYLFKRETLLGFSRLRPTNLEVIEGIELLRALDYGWPLGGIYTDQSLADIDVPEDIINAEQFILKNPIIS